MAMDSLSTGPLKPALLNGVSWDAGPMDDGPLNEPTAGADYLESVFERMVCESLSMFYTLI